MVVKKKRRARRRLCRSERTLPVLAEAVQKCKGCDLYRHATQAVFGEVGVAQAEQRQPKVAIMMIGEQPGDQEDKQGKSLRWDRRASCWTRRLKKRRSTAARFTSQTR